MYIGIGDCMTSLHVDEARTIAANIMLCTDRPRQPHEVAHCRLCSFGGSTDGTGSLWIIFSPGQTDAIIRHCRVHYGIELTRPGDDVPVVALLEAGFLVSG